MMWKLTSTKTRLFIVGEHENSDYITGTYLTREAQFKVKKISWQDWWKVLDPIVLEPLLFNVPGGCGLWKHPLAKNLRKSFPWKTGGIQFFGPIKPEDKTMQKIGSIAFGELYGRPKTYPTLLEGLDSGTSIACAKRFIIDRSKGKLLLLGRPLGEVAGATIRLFNSCSVFKELLVKKHGIPENYIHIAPPIPKPKDPEPVDMVFNKNWIEGYHPEGIAVGYSVIQIGTDKMRTYTGVPGKLLLGWILYNSWGV